MNSTLSIFPNDFRPARSVILTAMAFAIVAITNAKQPPDGDQGNGNTAEGTGALQNLLTGLQNTADGQQALFNLTTGNFNSAVGAQALSFTSIANQNTAMGYSALHNNISGNNNTAAGMSALNSITTGNNNIGVGFNAGFNVTIGDYNIDIGNQGNAIDANTIRIGDANQTATFIAGINGVPVVGTTVVVDGNGQLGTLASSERFKHEIKPMDETSETIFDLKPVTFRYKQEIDPNETPQFGLVAEEVAKIDPDLVVRDAKGKIYSVRYDAVNAMLLNEFLKEHQRVEELESAVKELQKQIAKPDSKKKTLKDH